jgi:beta-lactamase class D
MLMKRIIIFFIGLTIFNSAFSQHITIQNFKPYFDEYAVEGCFVLFNPADDEIIRYNPGLCDTGYIPASTFKIPNALIALEEGIVRDTNQVIKWDGYEWPTRSWNQDQTLKTAMKYSCVWAFSRLAEEIGIDTYYKYINSFDYGNKILIGQPNRFWLAGLLRISANQQIEFLNKFYNYSLPVSERNINIVKDIIVLKTTDTYRLSGKTGGAILDSYGYIMWFIGYVEKNDKTFFYALNFIADDFDRTSNARYEIARNILRQLDLIE